MRLAVDTSSVSFRFVGTVLVGIGVLMLLAGIFVRALVPPGLLLTGAGVWLRRSHRYIITHPPSAVLQQITHTLDLMMWKYDPQGDTITVPATGTLVQVKPLLSLGSLALLSFRFRGASPDKEQYLASTLVKYQRFVK